MLLCLFLEDSITVLKLPPNKLLAKAVTTNRSVPRMLKI